MKEQFTVGDMYFRVKYGEPERRYPLIDSFVYVGKNLSEEDTEDCWYFQFADSYAKHGSVLESKKGNRRVVCLNQAELHEMFNEDVLLNTLREARQRRSNRER
jgi:hypothetical protein